MPSLSRILVLGSVILSSTACKLPAVPEGKNGKDGASAGILSRTVTADECLTGGFAIETWIDADSDGKFDSKNDRNKQVAVVCNGSNGLNGHSTVSEARTSTETECAATGGEAIDLWTDVNGNGTYDSGIDSGFRSLVACNGVNGADGHSGTNGQDAVLSSGAVGPSVPNKSYSACHHDFLYLANGWLFFRHQANGTGDQGVGTTGFNVWNVDISDFSLISEVGGVTYCTLHFNKAAHTLSYTITDPSDGMNGLSGVIQL